MTRCCLAPLLGILCIQINAETSIGVVRATPTTAVTGTPTPVKVSASITDPTLISGGVNLLQLNRDGSTTILGVMHDDGLNGDAFAGDKVFTLVATLSASSDSQIQLQVAAAFKGALERVKSSVTSVFFQPANAPQKSITAIVQSLMVGDISTVLNSVVPSDKTTNALNALNQQGLNALASMLRSAVLVRSQDDLKIFTAPFVTPTGTVMVEFTMMPSPTGQWLINSW